MFFIPLYIGNYVLYVDMIASKCYGLDLELYNESNKLRDFWKY